MSVLSRSSCNLRVHPQQSVQSTTYLRALCVCVFTRCDSRSVQPLHSPLYGVSSPPAGYDSPGSVLISPVPHQMMSYMNMGSLSRTELQLLNQLHCRRKRRHRTIFTDEQLEALEGLFQETKYPDVGTREQLARKVHLREEKVEVRDSAFHHTLRPRLEVQHVQTVLMCPSFRFTLRHLLQWHNNYYCYYFYYLRLFLKSTAFEMYLKKKKGRLNHLVVATSRIKTHEFQKQIIIIIL